MLAAGLVVLFGSLLLGALDAPGAGAVADAGAATPRRAFVPVAPGEYRPPVDAPVVDPFRLDHGPFGPGNRGLEYGTRGGERVTAVGPGRVAFAGRVAGRLAVTVLHPDGRRSSLTRMAGLAVREGDLVARGSFLGTAGRLLHLGVREGDRYVDPAMLFSPVRRRAVLVPVARVVGPEPVSRLAGPAGTVSPRSEPTDHGRVRHPPAHDRDRPDGIFVVGPPQPPGSNLGRRVRQDGASRPGLVEPR